MKMKRVAWFCFVFVSLCDSADSVDRQLNKYVCYFAFFKYFSSLYVATFAFF